MDMALRGDIAFTADWARTLTDPQAFAHAQRCLGYAWTFLGFTGDVAKDGDGFRASLATRSVFVQRFGSELKGFENVCAHRFHPLRTEDRGNGPIVCGFHHWRYDKDGFAIGIPKCQENFGTVSRALGAHLAPIEIATCGTLVFASVGHRIGVATVYRALNSLASAGSSRATYSATARRATSARAGWLIPT